MEIPGLPTLQSGSFGHWRARRKHDTKWKNLVHWGAYGKRPAEPLERAFVVCTRYSAARSVDQDNLVASFKPLIDALATAPTDILVDDKPEHMTAEYHWQKCPRGEGRVVMEVSEVGER